jgi:hypothetical protein
MGSQECRTSAMAGIGNEEEGFFSWSMKNVSGFLFFFGNKVSGLRK